jgi:hypothetical protein
MKRFMSNSVKGVAHFGLLLLAAASSETAYSADRDGFWQAQASVYTRHFSPSPEHNNHQQLIGLERNQADGWIYGGATFKNSFNQRSFYGYAGKRFEHPNHPIYAKLSGGLLYGYKGRYKDKIPLNRFGVAPAFIPAVGVHLGPVTAEMVLLGNSAAMRNAGLRF